MSRVLKNYSFEKWIYKASILSTNAEFPFSVSKNSNNTNIVLYSYIQSAGKGQIGRKWYSGVDKNMTFSLQMGINHLLAKNQFHLNMIISLSLRDWIASVIGDHVCIKWPNDIYKKNKKVAGILIQNTLSDQTISKSLIGVGININEDEFPSDLPNPISFKQICAEDFDLNLLFANMLGYLEKRFQFYDEQTFQNLQKQYNSKLYLLGKVSTFALSENKEHFSGIIQGVTNTGQLEIEDENGLRKFNHREIIFKIK